MAGVVKFLAVVALGLGLYAVGWWHGQRDTLATNDHTRHWRDGYRHGFTTGRTELLAEQASKAMHPTAHPLSDVRRIVNQEAERLWTEGGE